jgi:probable rRNA maturation factor
MAASKKNVSVAGKKARPASKPVLYTRNRQRRLRVDRAWLTPLVVRVLADLDSPLESLGIILVTHARMAGYNERIHQVAGPTDILTFHYDRQGELIISTDHVVANARRFRTTPQRELALYVIHGILHLHGYDDQTSAQRRRMRAAEGRFMETIVVGRRAGRGRSARNA